MKQQNSIKIVNITLIATLCIITIGMIFLILLGDLRTEKFAFADNSPTPIISNETKNILVNSLMSEYNCSEQDARVFVEETVQDFFSNEKYYTYASATSSSTDWGEVLKGTALAIYYIGGRHYAEYDHIYIDKSTNDNYYYVAPNKNSLAASSYNDMNIELFNRHFK